MGNLELYITVSLIGMVMVLIYFDNYLFLCSVIDPLQFYCFLRVYCVCEMRYCNN